MLLKLSDGDLYWFARGKTSHVAGLASRIMHQSMTMMMMMTIMTEIMIMMIIARWRAESVVVWCVDDDNDEDVDLGWMSAHFIASFSRNVVLYI